MSQQYNADSIRDLGGILGGVRAKPASIGLESHNHTFLEILGNSIDEARAGFGDTIKITKNEDGSTTIRDYGRGVPMGKNKEGIFAYTKVFDELWAGGKYDNNEEEGGSYEDSLGTNGVGATGTNYTSDFFTVYSFKPEGTYFVRYEKGLEVKDSFNLNKLVSNDESVIGTEITWRPSTEVFRGKGEIDDDFIVTALKDQSIVNGGIKFVFNNKKTGETTEYFYENGINDYIKSLATDKNELTDVIHFYAERKGRDIEVKNGEEPTPDNILYRIKANVHFAFNREVSYNRYYHNTSWLENGGTPEDFIKNSFTFVVDKFLKENKMYDKKEKKVSFDDIADSLIVITSTYSTISLFSDQTKKKIESDLMKREITKWMREQLEVYFVENPKDAEVILKQILVNKRSREKAEKTRLDVKKKLSGTVNNLTARVDGFVNCTSRDNTKTELFVVEGKSALGSTKQGRDRIFQAIYAIRGKILNCSKADYNTIFKNDIIVDLIKLMGCGVEVKDKAMKDLNTFDIEKLKWSKIIITTDADYDGFHIRTLLLALFFRLMPTLIEEGYIYIAESPLYEIENNGESTFAYSDKEKDEIVATMSGNVTIQRSKGLGENTAEMMGYTTMNPETRKLIQVLPEDRAKMEEAFELFMGDDMEGRKQYIEENLRLYVEEPLD